MDFILDTNICIYIIKKKPALVFERFESTPLGSVGISTITEAELNYGVKKSLHVDRNRQALSKFLIPLEIANFDSYACEIYGNIRSDLEKKGTPIGPLDTLIAAHALSLDAILVTNNVKEFARIPNLKVENWTE